MRWISVLAVALVAATVQAEEPPLPKKCLCSPPQLGIAKATGSGNSLVIELKLVNVKWVEEAKDVTVEKIVVVDGKEQKVTETQKVGMMVAMPDGWTSRILKPQNIRFELYDIQGKPVAWDVVARSLAKETAVLVSVEPVDPFYLQTTKSGTLVIVAPAEVLYPPVAPKILEQPGSGPRTSPPQPAPAVPGPATAPGKVIVPPPATKTKPKQEP
jgi:hypothetical protein